MSLHCGPQQGLLLLLVLFLLPFLSSSDSVCSDQIDRLYDWKKSPDTDVVATLKKQKKNTKDEFDERTKAIIVEFAQQVMSSQSQLCSHQPITALLPVPPRLTASCLSPESERGAVLREQRPADVRVSGSHVGPQRRRHGEPDRPAGGAHPEHAGPPPGALRRAAGAGHGGEPAPGPAPSASIIIVVMTAVCLCVSR